MYNTCLDLWAKLIKLALPKFELIELKNIPNFQLLCGL